MMRPFLHLLLRQIFVFSRNPIVEKANAYHPFTKGMKGYVLLEHICHMICRCNLWKETPKISLLVGAALRQAEQGKRIRMTFWGFPYGRRLLDRSHSSSVTARYGDIDMVYRPVPLYRSARANDINLCSTSGWVKDYVGYQDGHNDEYLALGCL